MTTTTSPRYSWQWRSLRARAEYQHDDDEYQNGDPVPCADCDLDCMPNTPPGAADWHRYIVHDHLWAAAGMDPDGGWLCVDCLERRLGRHLTADDVEDVPINNPGDSDDPPRLAVAKAEAALQRARRRLNAQPPR